MEKSIYNLIQDKCQTRSFVCGDAYLYLSCISNSTNGSMDGSEVIRLIFLLAIFRSIFVPFWWYRFLHALLVRWDRRFVNLSFIAQCLVLDLPMTALHSRPESHRDEDQSDVQRGARRHQWRCPCGPKNRRKAAFRITADRRAE